MLFSSVPFVYYFLPITLAVYFLVPRRLQNAVLLAASLVFYAWGEPKYVLLMLATITQGYIFGLLIARCAGMRRARVYCAISVTLSLLTLAVFKYADFFITNFNAATGLSVPLLRLALPVGISFYTFQLLSYTVDVCRGNVPAQRSWLKLAAYITMFPQLIAGPIVRYADVARQLDARTHSISRAAEGARRFTIGLGKKILLADSFAALVSACRAASQPSVAFWWLYALAFTLQIYFDFSGYSDMAIGLGRVLGFDFPENFNYPYISASVTEFWRRWHISLGSWFRDYLYIPLGGNRTTRGKWIRNILLVWAATGLWHGAAWNFLLWGLWFALLLLAEKLFLKPVLQKSPLRGHLYTLLAVMLGFVLFNAESLTDAAQTIAALFGARSLPLWSTETAYQLRSYGVLLVLGILGATPLPKRLYAAVQQRHAGHFILDLLEPFLIAALLLLCTAYLVDGSFSPFLYFRF